MKNLSPLQKIILKFLIIKSCYALVFDILVFILPYETRMSASYGLFIEIVSATIFILLLNDLYKHKTKFNTVLIVILLYPIVEQLIGVVLGNIFVHFCPEQKIDKNQGGLLALFDSFANDKCSFSTKFHFWYFEDLYINIKFYLKTFNTWHLIHLFLNPYILNFFLFFKFCLFTFFKEKNRNPFLSLIPIVNKITLLKITRLPTSLIWFLIFPFVRLFYLYKINIRLCRFNNINKSYAICMTILPSIFYGKLIFSNKHDPNT